MTLYVFERIFGVYAKDLPDELVEVVNNMLDYMSVDAERRTGIFEEDE